MKPLLNKTFWIKSSLFILSVIFSIGLIFASLELPFKLDEWVGTAFNFPGYDQQASAMHMSKARLWAEHLHLKTYGYIGLLAVIILIAIGLLTQKHKLAFIGAFAIFLPVFGHFALTMFFLAGLGFLRFLWIPFTDISPIFMRLGDIITLPRDLLVWLGDLAEINLRSAIPVIFIAAGVSMFILGVYTWFTTKFVKKNVAVSLLYKVSRHPQYLGWILWSYGMFLLPVDAQKRVWSYADSLPWLLSTMVIIAISMMEENTMKKQFGDEYERFRRQTAFMFPIPRMIKKALLKPLKILFGKREYDTRSKVLIFTGFYTVVLMIFSYIYLIFTDPMVGIKFFPLAYKSAIEQHINQLENGESRREKDIAAMNLERYGNLTYDPLIKLIKSEDSHTRDYAIRTLGIIGACDACSLITERVEQDKTLLSLEIIKAMGKLKCNEAEDMLLDYLMTPQAAWKSQAVIALGEMETKKACPFIISDYENNNRYTKLAYLQTLGQIHANEADSLLINQLEDDDLLIKHAAIVAISQIGCIEAVQPLKELLASADWETWVYATEALSILEGKLKTNMD
jgi:protein-S-isoprenylcysteine O-methyltransferase Ste14